MYVDLCVQSTSEGSAEKYLYIPVLKSTTGTVPDTWYLFFLTKKNYVLTSQKGERFIQIPIHFKPIRTASANGTVS